MKIVGLKIITLAAIMLMAVFSFAGNGNKMTVDQRATIKMQKVHSVCNLTQQQQVQVKQFYLNSLNNARSLKAAAKGVTKAERTALRKSASNGQQPYQNSLKTILTPEQLTRWNNSRRMK